MRPGAARRPAFMAEENGANNGVVSDAVRELERELRARGRRKWLRRVLVVVGLLGAFVAFRVYRKATAPPPAPLFETKAVERRDVVEQIQSTGTVKPLTEVQVGAQVSGRIVKVYVDFNSTVKEGDLLAEIDPSLFGAQVRQTDAQLKAAKASLERAEANARTAEVNWKRAKKLADEGVASRADVDQARGSKDVAEADVAAAKAQIAQLRASLRSARTTLAYSRIYSPIDGVVIDRAVDPGQTVAASFSAPVLFVIAQDLSKMQVLADIDEADVGKLEENMKAEVVVDAFPGEVFDGEVTQVRYSPNTVQGVVTYSAVVDVKNPELKLRPGMTATVTVKTREAKAAVAIPNAALRFKPLPEKGDDGKPLPQKPLPPLDHGQGRIWRITGGQQGSETIEPSIVKTGITDGVWTELKGEGASVDEQLVVEQRESEGKGFSVF